MKGKNKIAAFALTLAIGMGGTAYAASTSTNQSFGLGRITALRGYEYVTSVLKDTLGLTDEDITKGRNEGKTMYDIAKEKGMNEEQFRNALLEAKSEAIDEAVNKGTITKEEGSSLKENLKDNLSNCIGNCGQNQIQRLGGGKGGRMMGNGQRGLNCPLQVNSETQK